MRNTLEQCLREANPRYLAGVKAKRINEVDIHFVRTGTFQTLKQELLKRGASLNQVKIPLLLARWRRWGSVQYEAGNIT